MLEAGRRQRSRAARGLPRFHDGACGSVFLPRRRAIRLPASRGQSPAVCRGEGAGLVTGCRYSELCRLAPGDFNADALTLTIHTSKSGKPRHVVLADDGVAFFEQAVAKAGSRSHLFVRADGAPWRTSWQIRPMVAACARAGIVPGVGFHILRHTWASLAVMNGAPLMVVARNLGHADTRMVEMHYGHLSPNFVADEIRRTAPRFDIAREQTIIPIR